MDPGPPRKPLIAGNWKMNLTEEESVRFVRDFKKLLPDGSFPEVVLAPPFPCLPAVREAIDRAPIGLAAQNLHWEDSGAYTGEVSAAILHAAGCRYVLVGHSERRQYFGETDHTVALKVRAALENHLRPIICVGEDEAEREAGRTRTVVRTQLLRALEEVRPLEAGNLIIAYEPVWAIGTGKTATVEQAEEIHERIRYHIGKRFPGPAGDSIRILYGGSVNPRNIDALMGSPFIDGALVGGASLNPEHFARIVRFRPPS